MATVLEELGSAARAVADRVGPAVVRIGAGAGRGAGLVVGDGLVVTNAHNLRGAETTVTFADGHAGTGQVRGVDADGDLAVVAVETGGVEAPAWADTAPASGDAVFAVAAGAGGSRRVSFGLVSAVEQAFRGPRGRRIGGSFEHTAALARGSSGSPVVDGAGRVVGLSTNRLGEGFYLAIPTNAELRARVEALGRGEAPTRVRLGVAVAPPRAARALRRSVGLPERDGVLVREVADGEAADRAGLRVGDLIVTANGGAVTSVDDLYDAIDALTDGAALALEVVRGTDELAVSVTFGPARDEGSA